MERLHISVKRGSIQYVDGGFRIPANADMRVLFPCCRSGSYSAIRRSMQRAGFSYCSSDDTWVPSFI
jgi:hypothetical protein